MKWILAEYFSNFVLNIHTYIHEKLEKKIVTLGLHRTGFIYVVVTTHARETLGISKIINNFLLSNQIHLDSFSLCFYHISC